MDYIKINKRDMVALALNDLKKGTKINIDNEDIELKEDIKSGHKFALYNIKTGEKIIKYGNTIGLATKDINKGEWVHTHNIKTGLDDILEYKYEPDKTPVKIDKKRYFKGFKRSDNKVGIRNEIWILPTVGCVNNIAGLLEKRAKSKIKGSIDDIVAFSHPYGCSQMGEDQENTRKIFADMIMHPNAGGVLVLGLGCENSNIDVIKTYLGDYDKDRVKFLVAQEVDDEIAAGEKLIDELINYASEFNREDIDISELVIGLKCGGSDGFSGISANPVVGEFSDLLISHGGSTILTEVPEMFGAETLLMNRCENEEVFNKTVKLINDFKIYFKESGQTIYENPSPGNKAGGISTLEDKSLGCTQKSGSSNVVDVLDYAEPLKIRGLNLLSAPGNDLVASTALAMSGAHIVLFTTGRGTPFAAPVPTIKISSNTKLYENKRNWIDFNAGRALEDKTQEELSRELFEFVIDVASGKKVKSEEAGYHDWAIFKKGVTL